MARGIDLDVYEALVRRALEHGVPSGVVATIFELAPEVTKELAREVRVATYGTADRAEYLEHIEWMTLRRTAEVIEHGNPAEAARVAASVLGRQIAAAGKRPSDALTDARKELMDAFARVRESPVVIAPPGDFVLGARAERRPAMVAEEDD